MRKPILLALLALSGCVGSSNVDQLASEVVGPPEVTTSAASCSTSQSISVSWANLPGNVHDWIAIAPVGSDASAVSQWVYTQGAASGSYAFPQMPDGSYVVRAFADEGYEMLDESPAFDVTVAAAGTVSTDQPSYTVSQAITASWSGLPGNQNDWIAIAPAGSPSTTVTAYVYTAGQASGMHTFAGLSSSGSYVVRAFANDSYQQLGEAAFDVTSGAFGSLATDATNYAFDGHVVVTWTGFPGNQNDWIAIAPQGSPATTVTRWVYTAGAVAGSASLEVPGTGGTYVVRAFVNDSYNVIGESAAFAVGLAVSTSKASYAASEPVVVSWENMPTNSFDWIAIAPEGSPLTTVTTWAYTNGQSTGQSSFGALPAGSYVARGFLDNTYTLLDETAVFTVGSSAVTVSSSAATYAVGEDITVTWSGLPGNTHDWIAIAPEGSADTVAVLWVYTGGQAAGSTTFVGGAAAGSYVARAFEDDSYVKLGETTAFVVQ